MADDSGSSGAFGMLGVILGAVLVIAIGLFAFGAFGGKGLTGGTTVAISAPTK